MADHDSSKGGAGPAPAFPPDTWERLQKLERACEVTISGFYIVDRRHWEVLILERCAPHRVIVQVQRQSITGALGEALAQAEARGWPG